MSDPGPVSARHWLPHLPPAAASLQTSVTSQVPSACIALTSPTFDFAGGLAAGMGDHMSGSESLFRRRESTSTCIPTVSGSGSAASPSAPPPPAAAAAAPLFPLGGLARRRPAAVPLTSGACASRAPAVMNSCSRSSSSSSDALPLGLERLPPISPAFFRFLPADAASSPSGASPASQPLACWRRDCAESSLSTSIGRRERSRSAAFSADSSSIVTCRLSSFGGEEEEEEQGERAARHSSSALLRTAATAACGREIAEMPPG
mmetsp:Transcript_35950/g.115637  ORF Transcript_35950/g.115637 Transcript_35950/m.115637 type:complete len:262 (+) Transcript_35950:881-1666(+)